MDCLYSYYIKLKFSNNFLKKYLTLYNDYIKLKFIDNLLKNILLLILIV